MPQAIVALIGGSALVTGAGSLTVGQIHFR